MHEREAQNSQKRNRQLHEQYTRLDIACSYAAEELASANSQSSDYGANVRIFGQRRRSGRRVPIE